MNLAGPLATMMLADQGARVIKLEPPEGDIIRKIGTGRKGTSAYFSNINRNKQSLCLDLKSPEGVQIALAIARRCDVVIQNYAPGVADRLGVGEGAVRAVNPEVVYVTISGYGEGGPLSELPAYDHVIQAITGIAEIQHTLEEPSLVHQAVIDKSAGLMVAQAVTAALLGRSKTGHGEHLTLSLLDAALAFLWPDGMMNFTCLDETVPMRKDISTTFRTTETRNGHVSFMAASDTQWRGLLRWMEIDSVNVVSRVDSRAGESGDVLRQVGKRLKSMDSDQAVEELTRHGVPAGRVRARAEVLDHEQVVARDPVRVVEDPLLGAVRQVRPAARLTHFEPTIRPAPMLGEHGMELLSEFGFSHEERMKLVKEGVVHAPFVAPGTTQ
jgi:crotonobetainyl-CoA:carnitine CoA-transferase CaiB-like acyl-CoA transferase